MLKNVQYIFIIVFVLSIFFGKPEAVKAAGSATISFSPQSGTYQVGKPFSVNVMINGNGQSFNAASATVVIPPQLQISNLVLGDCNFAFINTPTTANPSFVGALLGRSSSNCTVYTVTFTPITTGSYTTSFGAVSVKQTGTAAELSGKEQFGTYTVSTSGNVINSIFSSKPAPTAIPLQTEQIDTGQNKLKSYEVNINVLSAINQQLSGVTVSLDQSSTLTQSTNKTGTVAFSHISPGVHVVTITYQGTPIGKEIINVNGLNHILTLGIKTQNPPQSKLVLIATGIILALFILFACYKIFVLYKNKKL